MHDSTIASWGNIYSKLERCDEAHAAKCIVQSAFCRGSYPFLLKSWQDHLLLASNASEVVHFRKSTSAWKGSEWRMRSLHESFPRLKDRMVYEERGERKWILVSVVRLFNLCSRLVGISQLLSTHMTEMGPEANYLAFSQM